MTQCRYSSLIGFVVVLCFFFCFAFFAELANAFPCFDTGNTWRAFGYAFPSQYPAFTFNTIELFKTAIEVGDLQRVNHMIGTFRELLINSQNRPRQHNRNSEHWLHLAARNGQWEVCALILNTIRSPFYYRWVKQMTTVALRHCPPGLLYYYLNGANRSLEETPLHLAAKHGFPRVVAILIIYPQCLSVRNKSGQLPADINAYYTRIEPGNIADRITISELLRCNYYVPLMRTEITMEMPTVGEPFAREDLTSVVLQHHRLSPPRFIKAYAGPMSHCQALAFHGQWSYAQQLSVHYPKTSHTGAQGPVTDTDQEISATIRLTAMNPGSFGLTRPYNAMERIGRYLSRHHNVQWVEYWMFLRMGFDLNTRFGLQLLERYLATRRNRISQDSIEPRYAIGANLDEPENISAMVALFTTDLDSRNYPCICMWRAAMFEAHGTAMFQETVAMDML
uniref:ANKLE2 third alpha/beta domain-containing protein n=1 Tax=Anopheles maculatus TaxID=74869 RepID=A0A182SZ24_9DIPT